MKHCIFYKMVERYPPHSPNKTGDCIEEREDSWPPSWMIHPITQQEAHGPHRSPEKTVQINKHRGKDGQQTTGDQKSWAQVS